MKKTKLLKVTSIVLAICLLLSATLYIVFRNNEILRIALGNGHEYYMVIYKNGDFIVEYGMPTTTESDILKKPYIEKQYRGADGNIIDLYSCKETKLKKADVETIEELAKCLEYVSSNTEPLSLIDPAPLYVNMYYKGREIWINNIISSCSPELQKLLEKLIELSPMEIVFYFNGVETKVEDLLKND